MLKTSLAAAAVDPISMNTPLLRLFAAFWWLLVIGCIDGSYFWIEHVRHDYARTNSRR